MRDASRIPIMLYELGKVWEKYPDLRLGQLIMNAASVEGYDDHRVFMIEDGILLSGIHSLMERMR